MGDLTPHIINGAIAFAGPIASLVADVQTIHPMRGGVAVTNNDQANIMVRFKSGAAGSMFVSRVATGRKMGVAYELYGTEGSLRFDQEDQNTLWYYRGIGAPDRQGFTKILAGPMHPDYKNFGLSPGHGTGYQDQIIIEARDVLVAIQQGRLKWPTFHDGLEVNRIIETCFLSHLEHRWVEIEKM